MATATLTTDAGADAVGQTFTLTGEGLRLLVRVPDASPGDKELTAAVLTLAAVGDEYLITGGASSPITWASDLGAGLSAQGPVKWLTADLGGPLPLTGVTLTAGAGATPAPAAVKVERGDAFVPLLQCGTDSEGRTTLALPVSAGPAARFPRVVTERIMIDGVNAVITNAELRASGLPEDLQVAVGEDAPCFRQAGALVAGADLLVTGLQAAVNRYLAAHPGAGASGGVPLLLRAAVPGRIQIKAFAASSATVLRHRSGEPELLPLPWGAPASAQVTIGGRLLLEVRFTAKADLAREATYYRLEGSPGGVALLCDAGHAAAQGFAALPEGEVLTGVDLRLGATAAAPARFEGMMALHADHSGQPAELPFGAAQVAVTLSPGSEPAGGATRWVSCRLPPLRIAGPFWVVLSAQRGEARWYLGEPGQRDEDRRAVGARYRLGRGAWLPVAQPLRTLVRLHHARPDPAPAPLCTLRRGARSVVVPLDAQGQAAWLADPKPGQALLNQDLDPVLTLSISVDAPGSVLLSDVRIVVA